MWLMQLCGGAPLLRRMAESALRLSTPPELSTFLLGNWRPVTPSGTFSPWDKQKRPLVMTRQPPAVSLRP